MIETEYQASLFPNVESVFIEDPYVELEIFNKDPLNTYFSECYQWQRSSNDMYQYRLGGAEVIGLHGGRSLTSANLTHTFDIQESGRYWVLVRTFRNSSDGDKNLGLEIDGNLIQEINCYSPWNHYKYLDYGFIDLNKGNRVFKLYLNGRNVWVDHVLLYKLDFFNSNTRKSRYRLDYESIEFTENSMGDLNTASFTSPLKESWYDPDRNPYGGLCFDYYDVVNILVGDKPKNTVVKFGGYLVGYDISDENDKITFNGIDRLADLYGRPTYTNYYIGLEPSGEESTTFPALQFASGLEAVRHSIENSEYGPMSIGINYPYLLNKNFTNPSDFNSVTVKGFTKSMSPSTGLLLGYDKLIPDHCGIVSDLECKAVLFESTSQPFDASIHELLGITYLASGESCGTNSRVQFNINVSMYKAGETSSQAQTYTILFTGKAGSSNIIGQIPPVLNGIEQIYKFNLKQAFDNFAPSSNYYITKIELVDIVTPEQLENRQKSIIHIKSIIAYDQDVNAKLKVEQDTSYPYEVVKEILDELGYLGWTEYGRERRQDVFCVAPEMYLPSPIKAIQGVNVIGISDKSFRVDESVKNRRMTHYHYKEGDSEKSALSFAENRDSGIRYGPGFKESYDDLADVNNLTDADIINRKFIEKNSYPQMSFTLKIRGTSLLNPSQYIITKVPGMYIDGKYSTKTATHSITQDEGYITSIGVNRPDSYYKLIMNELEYKLKKYKFNMSRSAYNRTTLKNLGFSGVGSFIRGGY